MTFDVEECDEQEDIDYPEDDTFGALYQEPDLNKRVLRQKRSHLAEKRYAEQQHWFARGIAKARRDTQKKNTRVRKLYVKLHRFHRSYCWRGIWRHDDQEPLARTNFNVPNKYTCYAVGRRSSPQRTPQELESLCNVAVDIPHDPDLEYEVSRLIEWESDLLQKLMDTTRQRTLLLFDLVDAATDYVVTAKGMLEDPERERHWLMRSNKTRERNLRKLDAEDVSKRVEALNYFAQFGDIPQLEVIEYLAATEGYTQHYDHERMSLGERAEYDFLAAETPKMCGLGKVKLKRARHAPKRKLEQMLRPEERVVVDHSGLFRAVNAIVGRRAKAHHFAITTPNGNGELFDYLLKETQSRVDRGFFVDPLRVVLLQYGHVRRTVNEIVGDDVGEYLECVHAAVGSNGKTEENGNRKPQYVNTHLAQRIIN